MLRITSGQLLALEIPLEEDDHEKIELLVNRTHLPREQITLWILLEYIERTKEALRTEGANYNEFEEKLQQLERDVKMLLADCRERNARMNVVAQMMGTDFALQRD